MTGKKDWKAYFREQLPEATEEECEELAERVQEHVHEGHEVIDPED